MSRVFLTAEWRKLIMANYVVDPAILKPYLPAHTVLDFWNDNCYVSLVGFLFDDVKLKGISIPFHTSFEEVNLRFYVKHFDGKAWQRGVVFISEIVPLPAISLIANVVYGEKYRTMPVNHRWDLQKGCQHIAYGWKYKSEKYVLEVTAGLIPKPMIPGSETHFIFEHYYGFTHKKNGQTGVYRVAHPTWHVYDVQAYNVQADFEALYGAAFGVLNKQLPLSVFLAEGSSVKIFTGYKL